MSKSIAIFDHRPGKRNGASFSGSLDDADTQELIGWLDFHNPDRYLKRLPDNEKQAAYELVHWAERNQRPTYLSSVKCAHARKPLHRVAVRLTLEADDVFSVQIQTNG